MVNPKKLLETKKALRKVDKTMDYVVSNNKKYKRPESNLITKPGVYFSTGCAHAPWQNKKFYNSVFNFISKEIKLEGVILAGDIIDLNSLSSHDKGNVPVLDGVTLSWEYQESNKFLDEIDSLGAKSKSYIWGNHCSRYQRAMANSDTAKLGEALISPLEGLKLQERKYNVYQDWKNDYVQLGKIAIYHGEFLNVFCTKKTIDVYRQSTLFYHSHRLGVFMEGQTGGFNGGSGADFNAPIFGYASRAMKNSWVNACQIITLEKDGCFHMQNLVWMNNKLIVNGKSY